MPKNNVSVELRYAEGLVEAIIAAAGKGVSQAAKYYRREVEKEFKSAPWGSIKQGTFAKTVKHSPSGTTPYKQTGNLSRSVKIKYFPGKDENEGIVYSDAPYALELEQGGTLNTYTEKPYATRNLINPKPLNLKLQSGPRPTFQKVWQREESNIFKIIRSRVPFFTRMRVIFRI